MLGTVEVKLPTGQVYSKGPYSLVDKAETSAGDFRTLL